MAHVAATAVVAAAHTLVLAGQWDTAAKLLDGATYDDAAEAAGLAYAAAEVEVERAWWTVRRRIRPWSHGPPAGMPTCS